MKSSSSISSYLRQKRKRVDMYLKKYLPSPRQVPGSIHQAMHYSVFAGGKRLRPILLIAAAEMYGKRDTTVMPTACGIELLHTYSLVHDDLPCMDNDDFRRGKLTSHKVFGEAKAVLCGDALLTLAFECFARNAAGSGIHPRSALAVIHTMYRGAGTAGMLGGQVLDIEAEGKKNCTIHDVKKIHLKKTAALIQSAIVSGALLANARSADIRKLEQFGTRIGLAFQIVDDILDVTGTTEQLGKKAGSDTDNDKLTYVKINGIKKSHTAANRLLRLACHDLADIKQDTRRLAQLAQLLVKRSS